VKSPLKYHGGKSYLAKRIIELMPPRDQWCHYVEPYAGSLAVMLANDPNGISEVVNDLSGGLMNFWLVLQRQDWFDSFQRLAIASPFSEQEWVEAHVYLDDRRTPVPGAEPEHAFAFFINCRQSLSGRMKSFAPLSKTRVRRGMNEQAAAWLSAIDGLPEVHARLRRVVILNQPATDMIVKQDGPTTLFYLDPPYLPDERASPDVYECEMTRLQHIGLLTVIRLMKGKIMLSGKRSEMYDEYLKDWRREDFDVPMNCAGGKEKRRTTESVWLNF